MTLSGTIWDAETGQPVAGASVVVLNSQGEPTSVGAAADSTGNFLLDSATIDNAAIKLQVTSVGYQGVITPASLIQTQGGVGLYPGGQDLAPVVITAHQKPKSWWIWVALGLLVLLLSLGLKKHQVGKIDLPNVPWLKIALYIGIPVGAYFLIIRPILRNLGILDGKSNSPQAQANQGALDASIKSTQTQGGTQGTATYTPTQYTGWANDIYTQGLGSTNQDQVVNDVIQANTLMDILQLKQAFGTRKASTAFWSTCNWMNFNCPEFDLDAFLKQILDPAHVVKINQYLADTGINYTFA